MNASIIRVGNGSYGHVVSSVNNGRGNPSPVGSGGTIVLSSAMDPHSASRGPSFLVKDVMVWRFTSTGGLGDFHVSQLALLKLLAMRPLKFTGKHSSALWNRSTAMSKGNVCLTTHRTDALVIKLSNICVPINCVKKSRISYR
jgi:hypothetical protein